MIQVSGTGSQATATYYTSTLPAGFYRVGVDVAATGIPAAGPGQLEFTFGKDLANVGFAASFTNANLSQPVPRVVGMLDHVWLEPGDTLEFRPTQFNFGANPDCAWTADLYVYAGAEVVS